VWARMASTVEGCPARTYSNAEFGNEKVVSVPRMKMVFSCLRLIPHMALVMSLRNDDPFMFDIIRWSEIYFSTAPHSRWEFLKSFAWFMTFRPEFRNIFYLRHQSKTKLFRWLCPSLSTLEIASPNIGPGLFIQHGLSTLISAERIGANCWVNQQVTIGYGNGKCPSIGDNVRIHAGAKLIGGVKIGNNVTVGLNTVVLNDLPSDISVLGVPARRILRGSP
jgi:serine O-acetyltransferase